MSRRPELRGPTATLETLRTRASLLSRTRGFFAERGVLEVETPVLAPSVIVDAWIDPIPCGYHPDGNRGRGDDKGQLLYLQPSPEAPMKRLLSAGSGPIYQIAHAFRDGERGRLHNPEFTIVEWYRPGWDHIRLIEEVGELLKVLLGVKGWETLTYREAFLATLDIDPLDCPDEDLPRAAEARGIAPPPGLDESDRHAWLDLLLSTCVQPRLGETVPTFLLDYPPSQAALARIGGDDVPVAERFELFYRGLELCNGYHELLDPREHRLRFEEANLRRVSAGKDDLPADRALLAALEAGLPACSGVALGFDRVVMLAVEASTIDEVIAFPLGAPEDGGAGE